MASGGLTPEPLQDQSGFNWIFLVELLVCGILALFFLFYFNRLFAILVSYGLRAYTWHKYRVHVSVQALQISLLGGRVFFKGLRYHGDNETILIHGGNITWRYWLRKVRGLQWARANDPRQRNLSSGENRAGGEENGGVKASSELPCRILLSCQGLEWFVYNRGVAYQSLVSSLFGEDGPDVGPTEAINGSTSEKPKSGDKNKPRQMDSNSQEGCAPSTYASKSKSEGLKPDVEDLKRNTTSTQTSNRVRAEGDRIETATSRSDESTSLKSPANGVISADGLGQDHSKNPFLKMLPIHVECTKGAIVLGNINTRCILINQFGKAIGDIDATQCQGPDQYKQLINFELTRPLIQLRPNPDFKESQSSTAQKSKRVRKSNPQTQRLNTSSNFYRQGTQRLWHAIRDRVPFLQSSVESFASINQGLRDHGSLPAGNEFPQDRWTGLSRYQSEFQDDDRKGWGSVEYARFATLLESPLMSLSFYWDVAGPVPQLGSLDGESLIASDTEINHGPPPEWGLDLRVKGGIINYGPWTDRERFDLQTIFFPRLCKDSAPAKRLQPGQLRVYTMFKLFIDLEDETILRIPMREKSKDWKWNSRADTMKNKTRAQDDDKQKKRASRSKRNDKGTPAPAVRPFGWLDVKVRPDSTITYAMDMIARSNGYENMLSLELHGLEISTSVNHGLLLTADTIKVNSDLSSPSRWNALHEWKFSLTSHQLRLFILREHIFLLSDMIDDWGSGPPSDYYNFTPYRYLLELRLDDFNLYLNANDSNVINNPSDFDDNTFITIWGSTLLADVMIPLDKYRPEQNAISFDVKGKTGGLDLHTPPWNTQATFLESKRLATLTDLGINGQYNYYMSTSSSLTDTLLLNVYGSSPSVELYGFFIRYVLLIKDNYFGEDIHFKTLEEYQALRMKSNPEAPATDLDSQHHNKTNDLDVILTVNADNGKIFLPVNLYSSKRNIQIDVSSLQVDMRFTSYYMDLDVRFSPLSVSLGTLSDGQTTPGSSTSGTQLFINGVNIYGHRLFGLPPAEPTYVCHWDFSIGTVTGECSTEFMSHLSSALRNIAFSFDDDENALPAIRPLILHDVVFLRLALDRLHIWLHVDQAAFLLSTSNITLNFNDWAGRNYSERLNFNIPDLRIACVDAKSASRHRTSTHLPVETHAYIQTSVYLTMIERKLHFSEARALQQEHVRHHDQRTRRANYLLHSRNLDRSGAVKGDETAFDAPAMVYPPMAEPLSSENVDPLIRNSVDSATSSLHTTGNGFGHKSSFLSLTQASERNTTHTSRRGQTSPHRSSESIGAKHREPQHSIRAEKERPHLAAQGPFSNPNSQGRTAHSITFSSPFIAPYFPLEAIEPDCKDVPNLSPDNEPRVPEGEQTSPFNDVALNHFHEEMVHTSFIVNLGSGVRAFCNPQALRSTARLLQELKSKQPMEILDDIQADAIARILKFAKERLRAGKSTDLSLRVSQMYLRFINPHFDEQGPYQQANDDQYDVYVSGLSLTARSKIAVKNSNKEDSHEAAAVHLIMNRLSISASERRSSTPELNAAVTSNIEEVVFWFVSEKMTTTSLRVDSIELAAESKKLEFLTALLDRSTDLTEDLANTFKSIEVEHKKLLQDFIFNLTAVGAKMPDPAFLTRPSYVLRSAPDHLRISDSWKIMSRLRHMYHSLPMADQQRLSLQCLENDGHCHSDAKSRVLESFDQWRHRDLVDVRKSFVMNGLYGHFDDLTSSQHQSSKPMQADLNTGILRLVIDPGPKQNEVAINGINCGLSLNVPTPKRTESLSSIAARVETCNVQAYAATLAVSINLELLELAQNILKISQARASRSETSPPEQAAVTLPEQSNRHYHIVIAIDSGELKIETINIAAVSSAKGLNCSVVTIQGASTEDSLLSGTVSADATISEIRSHSRCLALSRLWKTSIYVSVEQRFSRDVRYRYWKLAGACGELIFNVKEDLSSLIAVLDTTVVDEVAYMDRFLKAVMGGAGNKEPSTPSTLPTTNVVNITLFLDVYQIRIPLLASLEYILAGSVARTAVGPRDSGESMFDFDVKRHSHEIRNDSSIGSQAVSFLQMPPINGRVVISSTERENTVEIVLSLESTILDAAAIHNLWNAFNKPEVEADVREIQSGLRSVRTHIDQVSGSAKKSEKSSKTVTSPKPLVYDARVTIAGLGIHASVPGNQVDAQSVHLEVNLESVQIKALNRHKTGSSTLKYPEIHLGLRQISSQLIRACKGSRQACGKIALGAHISCSSRKNAVGSVVRTYHVSSHALEIDIFAETAATVVDVIVHLQHRFKDLDLSKEKKYLEKFRRRPSPAPSHDSLAESATTSDRGSLSLFKAMYSFELLNIQVSWVVGSSAPDLHRPMSEDLVLVINRISLGMSKENSARLTIEDFLLQMVPTSRQKNERSLNSALLPEVVFNIAYLSTEDERRLVFQAAGKSLDLRLTSQFVIPASNLQRSIASASEKLRAASQAWESIPSGQGDGSRNLLKNKRLGSLLVDIDFAGATVYVHGKRVADDSNSSLPIPRGSSFPQHGRYGQFIDEDSSSSTTLQAPGVAFKFEYQDNGKDAPSLTGEVKVDASTNILYPTVVPLIMEISSSVKEVVSDADEKKPVKVTSPRLLDEDTILTTDPSAIFGRCKLNLGLRICKQEFGLSCQPIARVAANARAESIYITVNTIESSENGQFFAMSAKISQLQVSVQHVYSRESTGSFDVQSIVLSMMNSKHVSGTGGVSAILKISPMKAQINAKQLQDFLLFREIWVPADVRATSPAVSRPPTTEPQSYLVQRYQQVAATGSFTWNATVSIDELTVNLDLGQGLGKSSFKITDFWVSSKKSSNWEQNLCLKFGKIAINGTGRMSGFVELQNLKVRTSIRWSSQSEQQKETPLIQASLGFGELLVKAAFDYQAFLIADITSFEFLMYNVREDRAAGGDRLVGILDGNKVQVFCTTASASQALALYQAFQRLVQEKTAAYESSLKDIEKLLRRKSTVGVVASQSQSTDQPEDEEKAIQTPVSLHTDVVVTLRRLSLGAFPSTFFDNQLFKIEALDAQARFGVTFEKGQIHSGLGLTLGQLRVALSGVRRPTVPKTLGEVAIDEVVTYATESRGGTILKVPKVVATMQTWQTPESNHIDYIFKSSFEGKVDVGWNYSRISFIRGMWANHSRALALRLGKPLSQSAVKITGGPQPPSSLGDGGMEDDVPRQQGDEQEKITAVVNVPQSKYEYSALEPPVIETPQLRDMGEATPPLEWIGLHRERLPNVTHQIVIVTLLEVAREVEDAYSKILGSS
ncbi:MAG: hypothetical protein M1837_006862 [Sclerophora amabilis]|nr:MAG: hypothetical protein M1837_006862 [Sclerophora amabilis]